MKPIFSGNPDFGRAEDAMHSFCDIYDAACSSNENDEQNYRALFAEYLEFSRLIQALFISDNGYVIETGNFRAVNRAIVQDIFDNVKTSKKLWKMFMVC